MARFCGVIGFSESSETPSGSGVWTETIVEKTYYGDFQRNSRRNQSGDKVISDINISNSISILADPYANSNLFAIKYVSFNGAKWTVTDVEVQYPRLVLNLGGVYNG